MFSVWKFPPPAFAHASSSPSPPPPPLRLWPCLVVRATVCPGVRGWLGHSLRRTDSAGFAAGRRKTWALWWRIWRSPRAGCSRMSGQPNSRALPAPALSHSNALYLLVLFILAFKKRFNSIDPVSQRLSIGSVEIICFRSKTVISFSVAVT